jgi:TRAP-type transport system small permease protein
VAEDSLPWSEEAARYIMIWLSWIGGGLALRRGAHIAVDFLVEALPALLRRVVMIAAHLLTIGFLVLVFVYSIELTRGVAMQSTIGLGVSMQVPYAAMPIGTALMLYHALVLMLLGPSSEPKIETHVT